MDVLVARVELFLPASGSLKAKRSTVQSLVRTVDRWHAVGAAEVGRHDSWQRAELGFTVVADGPRHCDQLMDRVEQLIWRTPEVEVVAFERSWWEDDR